MGFVLLLLAISGVLLGGFAVIWYGSRAIGWGISNHPTVTAIILVLTVVAAILALFVAPKALGPGCRVLVDAVLVPC